MIFLRIIVAFNLANIFLGYYITIYSWRPDIDLIAFLVLMFFLFLSFFIRTFSQLKKKNKLLFVSRKRLVLAFFFTSLKCSYN